MSLQTKICAPADLQRRSAAMPRPLVFTNGVFDILHRGHAEYLERARGLGASLLVAVNSDRSARLLGKGPGRPFNTDADRAALIAALESVTMVTMFEERTPVELIRIVRPDVYVKGGDYELDELPEAPLMHEMGGTTVLVPFSAGFSTSSMVERIRIAACHPKESETNR